LKRIVVPAAAALALAASALPAFGSGASTDSSTVQAQVTVAAPCVQVTPSTLDYGLRPFSSGGTISSGNGAIVVTSCSAAEQRLHGRGTDATGSSGSWTLTPTLVQTFLGIPLAYCPSEPNRFAVWAGLTPLGHANATVVSAMGAGSSTSVNATLYMPCSGSVGAGEQMTFSIVFTATF